MTKLKAAFIHLTISIVVVGIFAYIIFFIWYPRPLAIIAGVMMPVKLLIMVDVIIGPLLTFVVYKKYKKSLKFDLSVIALFQIAALSYGIYTIYQGRPSLLVMNNGQFYYMTEKFANNDKLKDDALKPHYLSSPKYAYLSQMANLDIYSEYENFEALNDFKLMALPHSLTIENMKAKFSKKHDEIDALVNKYPDDKIVFFTLDKDQVVFYAVFSTTQNKIIDRLKF